MSMVPMRMQMHDPMPLRLGPVIKPPAPPLRVPEPPQHDWSCAQAGDMRFRSMWATYALAPDAECTELGLAPELVNLIKPAPPQGAE